MSLLLIVGIILAICMFVGYKKGLIKIAASLLTTVIIIWVVGLITPYISQWIRQATPLETTMQEKVVGMLFGDEDTDMSEKLEENQLSRNEQFSLLEEASIPTMFRQKLMVDNRDDIYSLLGVETFGEYVGAYLAKVVADILAFLIALLVVTIAVRIAMGMLGVLDKLPVIGGVNRIVGGVVGIGIGIVIVWILFIVVTLLYDTSFGRMCFENIESTPILRSLYDGNLLMRYIVKF